MQYVFISFLFTLLFKKNLNKLYYFYKDNLKKKKNWALIFLAFVFLRKCGKDDSSSFKVDLRPIFTPLSSKKMKPSQKVLIHIGSFWP